MLKYIPFLFFSINQVYANSNADTTLIKKHLTAITKTDGFRNYKNLEVLNLVAQYIYDDFSKYSKEVKFQEYEVDGNIYKNVICNFGPQDAETIVVGAHYDACGNQEGADDNASGVVGLLELARMLEGKELTYKIELVAYSLEEPPFFRSHQMGSFVHAKSLIDNKTKVYGMLCLEMIGYFDDAKGSQDYPVGLMSIFFGKRGNYISLVNKFGKGTFARKFKRKFKKQKLIETKGIVAPTFVQGIDFSDHRNYWKFGISSTMVTDTAFYRNKHYHKKTDTMDRLDIFKMGQVIDSVYNALIQF